MSQERTVAVVGAGTMGAGICQALAEAGCQVWCMDTQRSLVEKAFAGIRQRWDDRVTRGKLSAFQRDASVKRLHTAERMDEFKDADLVIEAVAEDLPLKRKLFRDLDTACPQRTILASNTSSLSISAIADGLKHADRVVGLHFFNPAPVMPLIEVIAGKQTGRQAIVESFGLAKTLAKTAVQALDRPGFIANRVARPFYLESLWMLGKGWADVATMDAAMRAGGFPMGPFELLDLIGLDVNLAVTRSVWEGFDKPARFAPNEIQEKLVADGRLGQKSGRGFYDYAAKPPHVAYEAPGKGIPADRLGNPAFRAFSEALDRAPDAAAYLYARIMTAVINEGAITAGEKTAKPRDINLAMTLGLRYPEGPMALADRVGLDLVLDLMRHFEQDSPAGRHTPAPLLLEKVAGGELGEKSAAGFLWHSL